MVVKSVVRRSRLRDLGVGEATFGAVGSELPVPVGATVKIPKDKKIGASVTIKNTGSRSLTKDFLVNILYGKNLSDSSGNPTDDYWTWSDEANTEVIDVKYNVTLNPEDTLTFSNFPGVMNPNWNEGDYIDAGIVVSGKDPGDDVYDEDYASLKIDDAVQIIAPTLRVRITNVTFFEM